MIPPTPDTRTGHYAPAGAGGLNAMNISAIFVRKPVATTLLTVAHRAFRNRRLPAASGVAAAAGGFSHHLCIGRPARRKPGNHGLLGRHASRKAVRPHRLRHAR